MLLLPEPHYCRDCQHLVNRFDGKGICDASILEIRTEQKCDDIMSCSFFSKIPDNNQLKEYSFLQRIWKSKR